MAKILIVEDETIIALDIKNTILKLGYEVSGCVTNYDDALKSVKSDEPDIIFMDINLRNSKDGIEAATDIKKIKNIPIIYLTAFVDDETIERAARTCPAGYIAKPFKRNQAKPSIVLALKQKEKLDMLYAVGLGTLEPQKIKIILEAMGELAVEDENYQDVKEELAYKILIESIHEIQSIEDKTKVCGGFVLKMEVVKDMLVNL